ncbi:Scr1 family TA system antitoxin-like transcriptional regulator [Streptomyces roseoverticillatus]|uniref:Scr1 family TA system antitoxin-like transcriptional regulator n=1 Tax=Streptomyces roseoverticillatus TaxID=66429 RepID=UPI0033D66F0A
MRVAAAASRKSAVTSAPPADAARTRRSARRPPRYGPDAWRRGIGPAAAHSGGTSATCRRAFPSFVSFPRRLPARRRALPAAVRFLPFAHGEHALMGGGLTLMTLDDGSSIAYEESAGAGTILEDPAAVQARGRAYSLLTAYALSPTETAAFMRDAMEALSA